jgi:hypothetical protein
LSIGKFSSDHLLAALYSVKHHNYQVLWVYLEDELEKIRKQALEIMHYHEALSEIRTMWCCNFFKGITGLSLQQQGCILKVTGAS